MVICDDERHSFDILSRLYDAGLSAVGPTSTAKLALALAALTAPTVALVARPPTGRCGAVELAETLLAEWNIPSVLLCADGVAGEEAAWAASGDQREALKHALKGLPSEVQLG